ncbi:hypothetical protein QYM36_005206 [Artemia franciscana]|uniref:Uncharacterized protein n=1 Tax=Artemia franciscana TaxID=6661 RepID=A0AA88I116_ARTSF|nr:hypothetical protein QYM36_005206 [Artemia franciscana]
MEDVEFYSNFLREDSKNVEDIAKQISEHAEKIYQTWREKGLSANDLIQLHNPDFVKQVNTPLMLSPAQKEHRVVQSQVFGRRSLERPRPGLESTVDLIASPDIDATLEELVSSFVKEDKARLAARQTEPVSSRVSPLRSVTPQLDLVPQKRISPNRPCQEPIRISPVRVISPVTPQKSLTSVRDTNPITIPLRSTTPTKDVSPPHKSITHIGPEFSPPSPTPQRSTTPIRESKVSGIYITKTKENNLIPQRTEVSYKTDIVSNVEDYRNKAEMDSEIVKISQIIKTTHSTVDYAKKRYEVAQANPLTQQRLSNAKSIGKPLQMNVVSEARTRFESKETYRKKVIREEHSERRITREESETFQLPHPYVTAQQRQQLKSVMQSTTTSSNSVNGVPIRPFLTRGSVAERILIFEKRPEKSSHPLRKSVIKSVPWKCKDDLQVR